MLQLMIIELLAREFAHAELVLVLSRRNAVLADCIAVAIFNRLGYVRGVLGFMAVARFGDCVVRRGQTSRRRFGRGRGRRSARREIVRWSGR
jgi:hypothetical protein